VCHSAFSFLPSPGPPAPHKRSPQPPDHAAIRMRLSLLAGAGEAVPSYYDGFVPAFFLAVRLGFHTNVTAIPFSELLRTNVAALPPSFDRSGIDM